MPRSPSSFLEAHRSAEWQKPAALPVRPDAIWDHDVLNFIQQVWKYTPRDLPPGDAALNNKYYLPLEHLENYLAERNNQKARGHFKELFTSLVSQLMTCSPGKHPIQSQLILRGSTALLTAQGVENPASLDWDWYLACGLITKTKRVDWHAPHNGDLLCDVNLMRQEPVVPFPTGSAQFDSATVGTPQDTGKRRQPPGEPEDMYASKRAKVRTDRQTESKATAEEPDAAAIRDEIMFSECIDELLSHGLRSYASGFLVRDSHMSLWYADKMGMIVSRAFDFLQEPHLLLLAVAAMTVTGPAQMGISPFLRFAPGPVLSYAESYVVMASEPARTESLPEESGKPLAFRVKADTPCIYTVPRASGRRTTVVRVVAADDHTRRVCGRANLVARLMWARRASETECEIVRVVRCNLQTRAPHRLLHIVEPRYSVIKDMKQMYVPRAFMEVDWSWPEYVCSMVVVEEHGPIQSITSIEEFKQVYTDVVIAHSWVWATSSIIHRNISTDSIRITTKDGTARGVLCNWDQAGRTDPEAEAREDADFVHGASPDSPPQHDPTAAPHERLSLHTAATTWTFTAVDLLARAPPAHRPLHELESFLYLLAYFCVAFDPSTHTLRSFPDWEGADRAALARTKVAFLQSHDAICSTEEYVCEPLRGLWSGWVEPLWLAFNRAEAHATRARMLRERLDGMRRCGKEDSVQKLEKEVRECLAQRRAAMTHPLFVKILKASDPYAVVASACPYVESEREL